MWVTIAGEGDADLALLHRVVSDHGMKVKVQYSTGGKQQLDRRLRGYNAAARYSPWVVLRDLDQDEPCAGALVARMLPDPAPQMRFRIAVRTIEAWLLADREAIAQALGVATSQVVREPERLDDPKGALVDLARRSRRKAIRADLIPSDGSGRRVGPGYTGFVIEFVQRSWDPERSAKHAPSLAHLRRRLAELAAQIK